MRTIVALAVLAISPGARADGKDAILQAARKAGYANPSVLAIGDISIIADAPASGPGKSRLAAIGPGGTPIAELPSVDAEPLEAVVKPFLGNAGLRDVDVVFGDALGMSTPHHQHFLVRAATLDLACTYAGDSDSGTRLKDQRYVVTVTVARISAKPLVFQVTEKSRNSVQGRERASTTSKRFELGDTGACVEKK